MKKYCILLIVMALALASCNSEKIRTHIVHVVSTGDVHGSWFDDDYLDPETINPSLMAVSKKINDLRATVGAENLVLVDAGDCLQGDVAPYYFNYVKDNVPHLFPRIVKYMKYDCVVVGNHDIEAGHPVYDKLRKELDELGVPWLAGNVIDENGDIYFNEYKVVEKDGLKVLLLGYTNPNIAEWLQEEKWKGLKFNDLIPYVQERVDVIKEKEKPQLTIVAIHSGSGEGNGKIYENQGLDLFKSLKGVDLLITAHDHRPLALSEENIAYINGGAKAQNIGHAVVEVTTKGSKVLNVNVKTSVDKVDKDDVDIEMKKMFENEYQEVKSFSTREIGTLDKTINTIDAYKGQSAYINLINTVMLGATNADVAFTAPLTYNGAVEAGEIRFCDLRTIYPFENELVVLKMTGSEIVGFLEFSYDKWINTVGRDDVDNPDSHLLKIVGKDDPRNGTKGWAFENKSYNFEAAAGLNYVVDVTRDFGERVKVKSLADGSAFAPETFYNVAMTSYRFSGAGDILTDGAGINKDEAAGRIVAKYREIRDLISDYITENQDVKIENFSNEKIIGKWKFVPSNITTPMLENDMKLLFPNLTD